MAISVSGKSVKPLQGDRRRSNLRGMLLSVASGFVLMASFGLVRHATAELHAFEVTFFRTFFGLLFLTPWLLRSGLKIYRTAHFGLHFFRNFLHAATSLVFVLALTMSPFAELTALYFVSPVFVTIMAIIFLREVVGFHRWTAVMMGFTGMLVILRPGIEVLELGSLLAVASALTGAGSVVVTKVLTRTESVATMTAYAMTLMSLLLIIPAAFVWQWPSLATLPWLIAIGFGGVLSNYLFASSIEAAEISVITPLSFLQLLWAAAIGFLFFDEIPEIFVWIGGSMIFSATTYIAVRERVAAKADPQTGHV